MARDSTFIATRLDDISHYFRLFDAAGDLTTLTPVELLYLTNRTRDALDACDNVLREHERSRPSTFWFLVSFLSGIGSLFFLEPNFGSIAITAGGALGAIKSLYDLSMHLGLEQGVFAILLGHHKAQRCPGSRAPAAGHDLGGLRT